MYGTVIDDHSEPHIPSFAADPPTWDQNDRMMFGASVAAALLLAGLIVIL